MFIRKPVYYDQFQCIAEKCTDTCCAGWEIDIDEDTMELYSQVEGEFGELLKKKIHFSEEGEPAHFILTKEDRCPFLNECNLCEIYKHLGESALSQICTDHPRFYEWYEDGREAGIGICCEEACRLILQPSDHPYLVEEEEIEETGAKEESDEMMDSAEAEEIDSNLEFESEEMIQEELKQLLFSQRETLFSLIKEKKVVSFSEKEDKLLQTAEKFQEEYDTLLFGPATVEEPENQENNSWEELFWNQDFICDLIDFLLRLDINDKQWKQSLENIRKDLPDILKERELFMSCMENRKYEYEQLLLYFLYRYFMKARLDDLIREKIHFALLSTSVIELLGLMEFVKEKELTLKRQIDLCKLFSKEIEYDEANVQALSEFITTGSRR